MENPVQTCYRHPDQPAGVICQRCDRPICPRCMLQASVGFHCPECAKSGRQRVMTGSSAFAGARTAPFLTYVLIAANVLVFVLGVVLDGTDALGGELGQMQIDFGLVARGAVIEDGAYRLLGVGEGEPYRIITSGFLHYGVFHLLVNMYALFALGQVLETGLGRLRTGLIYGAALVAGSLGALIVSPDALTVGASGAIFGLMGGLLMAMRAQGVSLRDSPLLPTLALNLGLTLFFSDYISVGGHLGGFVGGVVAGWVLTDLPRQRPLPSWLPMALVGAFAVVCAVVSVVVAENYSLV